MGHPGTNADVFDTLVAFAKSIGMVALPLKEQPGYPTLVPLLSAGLDLLVKVLQMFIRSIKHGGNRAPTGPLRF
jgi:hypothetical protein